MVLLEIMYDVWSVRVVSVLLTFMDSESDFSLQQLPDARSRPIITASPLENWMRPPGRPRTTWMKTIQQDLRSNNLSVDEAITVAQNRPLWRLMSAFGATQYASIVVFATQEEEAIAVQWTAISSDKSIGCASIPTEDHCAAAFIESPARVFFVSKLGYIHCYIQDQGWNCGGFSTALILE